MGVFDVALLGGGRDHGYVKEETPFKIRSVQLTVRFRFDNLLLNAQLKHPFILLSEVRSHFVRTCDIKMSINYHFMHKVQNNATPTPKK